jgi:hypothetical protein
MLYLIVDPKVFLLSETEISNSSVVSQFLAFLVAWARSADEYDIEFGITQSCLSTLTSESCSVFNRNFLDQLVGNISVDAPTVRQALEPLTNHLLKNSQLDSTLAKLRNDTLVFEVNYQAAALAPSEYLDRLNSDPLRNQFKEMLCIVVFARQQCIIPLSELTNVRLLTTYSVDEIERWARDLEYRLLVHIPFSWVLSEKVVNREALETLEYYDDQLETTYNPNSVKDIAPPRFYSSMVSAVEAACRVYPKILVFTDKARDIAEKSKSPKLTEIYRCVRGLVETWLPAYREQGEAYANKTYYESYSHEISREGEQVNNNPAFRAEREAFYQGQTIYAELHVKLALGMRIYFTIMEDGNSDKIILTRVGKHPSNATAHS